MLVLWKFYQSVCAETSHLLAVVAQFSPEPEIPGALPNAPELGVGRGKETHIGPEIGRHFSIGIVLKNSFKNF